MAKAEVHVESNLPQVLKAIDGAAEEAMRAAAEHLKNAWVLKLNRMGTGRRYRLPGGGFYTASAPGQPPARRTGRLARSVKVVVVRENGKVEARVGSTAFYAVFQEFGTRHQAARPSLRPTVDENLEEMKRIIAERLRGAGQ